ncbi:MAG: ParB/RepB/Spo0J family partition protein [Hydrogenophaga sp.]|uniref:ParB/RepB/Spo0J family partition protein n=1 Tax=Hydrogenophaga sp. TaxID=1904254 RepID=UPI00272FD129|nr:ParB/RepB/Spo0J family partition protein [Hydrogenophaga sp.]MDP2166621.1 ParB/RepB/Spo0J family partition protein [Hydrogenophaga sp.]
MTTTTKKRGLGGGRGLDALLSGVKQVKETVAAVEEGKAPLADGDLKRLPVEFLQRGRYQPRRDMDPAALQELADSIKTQGVMQPIVVRPIGENKYEIVAGERRWRATQLAGIDVIPAIIREIPDETAIAMALIENIQRENLNPMEEAIALQRFADEFQFTHQQVADAVGKSRATVSNLLRLMSLNSEAKMLLEHGDLEMGHAKALLGLPENLQGKAGKAVVAKGLSVRQTEAMVRTLLAQKAQGADTDKTLDPNVRRLQDEISEKIGAPVQIECNAKGKGRLVINYNTLDELDGILAHIR